MAIVPLARVTLCGPSADKEAVLAGLQDLGCCHLEGAPAHEQAGADRFLSPTAHRAFQYLARCPNRRRQVLDPAGFHPRTVEAEALAIEERLRVLDEERDHLTMHIRALAPWGDFAFDDPFLLGELRLWFYIVPLYRLAEVAALDLVWQVVHQDGLDAYVVVIAGEEPQGLPVPRVHTGSRSLAELRQRLEEVEAEQEDLHWRRAGLTRWLSLFGQVLAAADDAAALAEALRLTSDQGGLFVLEAWSPEDRVGALAAFCRQQGIVLVARPVEPGDRPPTLLANEGVLAGGELLVRFYTTPAYHLWDPSRLVAASFVLFFAMIVADAGYGLALGLLWLAGRRRWGCRQPRLCQLAGLMILATVGYGTLVGSYFGLPPPAGPLASLVILDLTARPAMMAVSVVIGAGHLLLGQAINLARARTAGERLAAGGWIMILAGGLAAAGGWWQPAWTGLAAAGWPLLAAGSLTVLVFSSSRPFRQAGWRDLLGRLLDGALALTNLSRAFGDVLSYLRLFALGLASAQLAMTFNELAASASRALPVLGSLVAAVIAVAGHSLNAGLAVMGGVIHGLRLNLIELFGWTLTDEGRSFQAFSRKEGKPWTL
ncbi:MAG: V-type ATP synthase subunit I [Thermodesulfobacteriota bacterium]